MKLTVTDAAKQWGITRNTIYNNINNGKLSRDSNKMIDTAEMFRAFGEPKQTKRVDSVSGIQGVSSSMTPESIAELQHQLELEQLKNKHLKESLQKQELVHKDYQQQITHYQRQIELLNDNLSKANMSIQELVQSRLIGMDLHKPTEDEEQLGSTDECVTITEPTDPAKEANTTETVIQNRKKWRWW